MVRIAVQGELSVSDVISTKQDGTTEINSK